MIYYSDTYLHKYVEYDQLDIYCFDKDDTEGQNLRYLVELTMNGDRVSRTVVYKVTNISNTFDAELLQIPEGYDIRTSENGRFVSTGETTGKDTYPN